uniref:Uncharacterized protein n=1 Tax=Eutreptiella gymnastica TaxID=73025 RepID=A0A7S1NF26_9EUGL
MMSRSKIGRFGLKITCMQPARGAALSEDEPHNLRRTLSAALHTDVMVHILPSLVQSVFYGGHRMQDRRMSELLGMGKKGGRGAVENGPAGSRIGSDTGTACTGLYITIVHWTH